jgi:hypothetical protein
MPEFSLDAFKQALYGDPLNGAKRGTDYLASLSAEKPEPVVAPSVAPQTIPPIDMTWVDFADRMNVHAMSYEAQQDMYKRWKTDWVEPYVRTWIPSASERQSYIDQTDKETIPFRKQNPTRGFGGALLDFNENMAKGAAGALTSATDIFGADNPASKFFREKQKNAEDNQTSYYKDELLKQDEERRALGASPSILDRAGLAARQIIRNPLENLGEAAGNVLAIAPAAIGGTIGVIGASTAMGVGAVKGNIYETVNNTPDADLMTDPSYAAMRASGIDEKTAKEALAVKLQSYTENPGKIAIGGAMGAAVGKFGSVEQALANAGREQTIAALRKQARDVGIKGIATGAGKEVATEIPQEMTETYLGNTGAASGGATVDPYQNVVEAGVKAGFLAAAPGGIAHVAQGVAAKRQLKEIDRASAAAQSPATATESTTAVAASTVTDIPENDFATGAPNFSAWAKEHRAADWAVAQNDPVAFERLIVTAPPDLANEITQYIQQRAEVPDESTAAPAIGSETQTVGPANVATATDAATANHGDITNRPETGTGVSADGRTTGEANAENIGTDGSATVQGAPVVSPDATRSNFARSSAGDGAVGTGVSQQGPVAFGPIAATNYVPAETAREATDRLAREVVARVNAGGDAKAAFNAVTNEHAAAYEDYIRSGQTDRLPKAGFQRDTRDEVDESLIRLNRPDILGGELSGRYKAARKRIAQQPATDATTPRWALGARVDDAGNPLSEADFLALKKSAAAIPSPNGGDTAVDISGLKQEIGWAIRGGQLQRARGADGTVNSETVTRSKWVPKSEFWPNRPKQGGALSEAQAQVAIDRAVANLSLSTSQQRFVDYARSYQRELQNGSTHVAHESHGIDISEAEYDHYRATGEPGFGWMPGFGEAIDAVGKLSDHELAILDAIDFSRTKNETRASVEAVAGRDSQTQKVVAGSGEANRATGEAATREGQPEVVRPTLDLTGQSEAQIRADEAKKARDVAAKSAQDNAPSPEGFTLTGSNRTADVGAAAGQQPMFSRSSGTPLWRSTLSDAVGKSPLKTVPADQWQAWLKSNAAKLGVKQEEIQWSGITDWLDLQAGKVSREQVQQYLDANGVKVTETELGSSAATKAALKTANKALVDHLTANESYEQLRATDFAFDAERDDLTEEKQRAMSAATKALADQLRAAYLSHESSLDAGTKYGQYQLPGGENYRELLLTLPPKAQPAEGHFISMSGGYYVVYDGRQALGQFETKDEAVAFLRGKFGDDLSQKNFKSSHWDQPNILAHIRFNERTDADGKRVLFIEEIQSDWGQEGKKKGFGSPETAKLSIKKVGSQWHVLDSTGAFVTASNTERGALEKLEHYQGSVQAPRVPNAPFVGKTEAWVSLALKRMIRYAVDNGFDRVAMVNGEQSAERYDLSKQIDRLNYVKESDGRYSIDAEKDGRTVVVKNDITADELTNLIGKDMTQKIVNGEGAPQRKKDATPGSRSLSGLDLKVGGEGMKAFYDKIVPQVANDALKRLGGGKVVQIVLNKQAEYNSTTGVVSGIVDYGVWPKNGKFELRGRAGQGVIGTFNTSDEAFVEAVRLQNAENLKQSGFDITDKMREYASQGMPMFQRAFLSEADALKAFGSEPDLFIYPKSNSKDLTEIAKVIAPGLVVTKKSKFGTEQLYELSRPGAPGVANLWVRDPNPYGNDVRSYDNGRDEQGSLKVLSTTLPGKNAESLPLDQRDVWIDVSRMNPGMSGSQIYAVAANYAHNNGDLFIGDPDGLSDKAMVRRTENMLNSALKFGTTEHLAPHPRQVQGDPTLGIKALDWVYGDHVGNVHKMIDVLQAIPENLRDDIASPISPTLSAILGIGRPENGRSDVGASTSARGSRATPDYGSTAARHRILKSVVRRASEEESGARGTSRSILARTLSVVRQLGLATDGKERVLYRRGDGNGVGLPFTHDDALALTDQLTKAGMSGINVVRSVADMPETERKAVLARAPDGGIRGAYFNDTNGVWLVTDNIRTPEEFLFTVLHEGFHRGLANTIGSDAKQLLSEMYATNATLRELTQEQMTRHGIGLDEAIEEALADMAGNGQARDLKGWGKLVDLIRSWLGKLTDAVGIKIVWTDDMIADFVAGIRRNGLTDGVHMLTGNDTVWAGWKAPGGKTALNRPTMNEMANDKTVVGNTTGRSADDVNSGAGQIRKLLQLDAGHDFKTPEGKFTSYYWNGDKRSGEVTVFKDKAGYVVRNIFIPDSAQKQGIGSAIYEWVNQQSIEGTGNPLRSTQPRTRNGESVLEIAAPARALWESLVKSGKASKTDNGTFAFKQPNEPTTSQNGDVTSSSNGSVAFSRNSDAGSALQKAINAAAPNRAVELLPAKADVDYKWALQEGLVDYQAPVARMLQKVYGSFLDVPLWQSLKTYLTKRDALHEDFARGLRKKMEANANAIADVTGMDVREAASAVGEYAKAKHVPDANAQLRAKGLNTLAAGLTDQQAAAVAIAIEKTVSQKLLEEGRQILIAANREGLQMMVDSRLMTAQQQADLLAKYPNYVPLNLADTEIDPFTEFVRTDLFSNSMNAQVAKVMKGYGVGSDSVAENGYVNTLAKRAAIHARIASQDFKLAALAMSRLPQGSQHVESERITSPGQQLDPRGMAVRDPITNDWYSVRFKDQSVQDAIYNKGIEQPDGMLRAMSIPTRLISKGVTQWIMAFAPINMMRDVQAKAVQVRARRYKDAQGVAIDSKKLGYDLLKYSSSPELWKAAWHLAFKVPPANPSPTYLSLKQAVSDGALSTWGDFLNKSKEDAMKELRKTAGFRRIPNVVTDAVEEWNTWFDTISSFASYQALRAQGVEPKAAAFHTLDLMNFRNKGKKTAMVRALYTFSNATIQDASNLARDLHTRQGWVDFLALTALGALFYGMAKSFGGEPPENEKILGNLVDQRGTNEAERNIPICWAKDACLKLPIGFGKAQLAWSTAVNLMRLESGRYSPGEALGESAKSWIKAFAPTGYSEVPISKDPALFFMSTLAPTVVKPAVNVIANKTAFGAPLAKPNAEGKFRSENAKTSTEPLWVDTAKSLRQMTGLDAAPEVLRELFMGFPVVAGPVAETIKAATNNKAERGLPEDLRDQWRFLAPLGLNRLLGGDSRYLESVYWERMADANELSKRLNVEIPPGPRPRRGQADRLYAERVNKLNASDQDKALLISYREERGRLREYSDAKKEMAETIKGKQPDEAVKVALKFSDEARESMITFLKESQWKP